MIFISIIFIIYSTCIVVYFILYMVVKIWTQLDMEQIINGIPVPGIFKSGPSGNRKGHMSQAIWN